MPEKVVQDNRGSSFTILEPGQTIDVDHDRTLPLLISLAEANFLSVSSTYDFASSGVGNYKFEPMNRFQHLSPNGDLMEILADHQPADLKLSGILTRGSGGSKEKRAMFSGCSADQEADTMQAIPEAQNYLEEANE